jgi:hypothetical protein
MLAEITDIMVSYAYLFTREYGNMPNSQTQLRNPYDAIAKDGREIHILKHACINLLKTSGFSKYHQV